MPLVATFRVDWFRVVTDITRTGIPMHSIAHNLGVSKSTIINWRAGSEPRHGDGEALVELWSSVTGKDRETLPVVVVRKWWSFNKR